MPPKDKLKKLHDNLVRDGYDLPDYNAFESDMADDSKRNKLHDNLLKEGYDLPDNETFKVDMGFGAESTAQPTVIPEKKNDGGPMPSDSSTGESVLPSAGPDVAAKSAAAGVTASRDQYEAVADYTLRSQAVQPFEKILKNFPELDQQWQESKLAFQPQMDETGIAKPATGGKAFLKNLGESQDKFIEQFGAKLKGQYDSKTNTYIDGDGQPIDNKSYKPGDILAIRNGMMFNGKPIKADFVQLAEGPDGKKQWVSFSKDQIVNPNFNQKDEDLLGDVIVSSPAFMPKDKPVNVWDMTTEQSNSYNQSLANKETDPVLKEAYTLNQNYGVGDAQITVLPRFFKMHPEIKDAYKQEFEANPGKHASIGGQREMIDESIIKTHGLDKSVIALTDEHPDVNQLELLTNLETLNSKGDVDRRSIATRRIQNLKQRAEGIQAVLSKTQESNKKEFLQSQLKEIGDEYNGLVTEFKPEIEAYQKARDYFDKPELKWFKDTLAKQNKGRLLLTQTRFLFPKSEAKEAAIAAEDENPDSAPLYIFKKFGGAVADILTSSVQFLGQAGNALSILPVTAQQRRAEQAYFSDVASRESTYLYSSEEGRSTATKIAGGVASMLPYFLPGGIAGRTGKILTNISFLVPEYISAQREAQAQGLDGNGANLYAALQTVPTAIALNMFHIKGSGAALPGKIGMETFNKLITPSLRKEGLKDLSSLFTKKMLTGTGKTIGKNLLEAGKFSVAHVANTLTNATANILLDKKFNTDLSGELGSMAEMAMAMSVISLGASFRQGRDLQAQKHNEGVQDYYLKMAAEGNPDMALRSIDVLRNSGENLEAADLKRLNDLEESIVAISANRFPTDYTTAQKIKALPLMNEVDRRNSEIKNTHESFHPQIKERIKLLNEQIAAISAKPESAAAEVETSTQPVTENVAAIAGAFEMKAPVVAGAVLAQIKEAVEKPSGTSAIEPVTTNYTESPITARNAKELTTGQEVFDSKGIRFTVKEVNGDTIVTNEGLSGNAGFPDLHTRPPAIPDTSSSPTITDIRNITDPEERKAAEIKYVMANLFSNVGEAAANKIREYADRIIGGQSREIVIDGLPKSFISGIDNLLAAEKGQPIEAVPTPTNETQNTKSQAPSVAADAPLSAPDVPSQPEAQSKTNEATGTELNTVTPDKVAKMFAKEPADNNFTFMNIGGEIWRRDNATGEITNKGKAPAIVESDAPAPPAEPITGTNKPATGGGTNEPESGGVKKTVVTKRAYEGTFRQGVKDELEKLGLTRSVENQQEAKAKAKDFVASVGIDAALEAVRNNDVPDAVGAYVWSELIESVGKQLATETRPDEVRKLQEHQAALINELGRQALSGSRFNSALDDIYQSSDLGYNAEKKISDYKTQNNGTIAPEVEAKFRELDRQLREVTKKLTQAEAAAALKEDEFVKAVKAAAAREKKTPVRQDTGYAKKALDALIKVREKIKSNNYSDAIGIVAIVDSGLATIELSIKAGMKIAQAIEKGIRLIRAKLKETGVDNWEKEQEFRDDVTEAFVAEGFTADATDGPVKIPHSRILEIVEGGAKNINEVVETLHSDFPNASDREIRDAVTNYGKTVNPNQEQIEVDIRRMKRVGRLISALDDVAAKRRPLKSGQQRDKLDAEARRLTKELKDAMKELPIDTETQDKQLSTALDTAKARIKNQIEELELAISENQKIVRTTQNATIDAELDALKKHLEDVRKVYDTAFGEVPLTNAEKRINALQKQLDDITTRQTKENKEKPVYTPEEQSKIDDLKEEIANEKAMQGLIPSERTEEEIKLDAIDRAIEETERKIRENDLRSERTPGFTTNAIEARKSQLKETAVALRKLREEAGIINEQKLRGIKSRATAQITELQRRLREKDFSDKKKPVQLEDNDLIKLKVERLQLQEEYDKEFYRNKLANRTRRQRAGDALWAAYGLTRALRATGELSFVLVQGGTLSLAHPLHAIEALKQAVKFMGSEKYAEKWLHVVKSQDWYAQAKEAKLAITEPSAKMTAAEELLYSNWTNAIWNMLVTPAKIGGKADYEKAVTANPFKALERAGTGYLNSLRVSRYLDGLEILKERKANGETITEKDYKDIADTINTLTGRGSLGALEQNSELLTKFFFSPKLWSSAIKTATPYALIHFGKMTPTARKMAIADYSKFVGITMAGVAMAAAALNKKDSTDGVEFDPRSSSFLKIRIGDTYIDPWGGKIQQVVLQARLIMGVLGKYAYKDGQGTLKKLGEDYKTPVMGNLMLTMATNKLAPSMAMLNKFAFTHTDPEGGRVDAFGQPYSFKTELFGNLYPIYWDTIKELIKDDKSGTAMDGLLMFYSFLGGGVNTYTKKAGGEVSLTKQREDALTEIAAALRTNGKAPLSDYLHNKMNVLNITNDEIENELQKPVFTPAQEKFKGLETEKKMAKWESITDEDKKTLSQTMDAKTLEGFREKFILTPELKSDYDKSPKPINPPDSNTLDYFINIFGNKKRAVLEDMIYHAEVNGKQKTN